MKFLLFAAAVLANEVLVYREGDMTCSGAAVQFSRTPLQGRCNAVPCFKTQQTKNSAATLSSQTVCQSDLLKFDVKGKYAVQIVYTSPDCADDKAVKVDALLTGGCYLTGDKYFKAECGESVKSWTCTDSKCSNCTVSFDGVADKCSNTIKYMCVNKNAKNQGAESSAVALAPGLFGLAALLLM